MRFKKVLSYLELEGQGHGIIMEVTRPLLLGPFYLVNWVKWPVGLSHQANPPAVYDIIQIKAKHCSFSFMLSLVLTACYC